MIIRKKFKFEGAHIVRNCSTDRCKKSIHGHLPISPSAESYSLMFLKFVDLILKNTTFTNGEGNVKVSSVRVHETQTGYAEAFREDMKLIEFDIQKVIFSDQVINEWEDKKELLDILDIPHNY